MIYKKIDENEPLELKKVHNHYLDKRKEIVRNTQFKVEYVFGDIIRKYSVSPDQITKVTNFSAKLM